MEALLARVPWLTKERVVLALTLVVVVNLALATLPRAATVVDDADAAARESAGKTFRPKLMAGVNFDDLMNIDSGSIPDIDPPKTRPWSSEHFDSLVKLNAWPVTRHDWWYPQEEEFVGELPRVRIPMPPAAPLREPLLATSPGPDIRRFELFRRTIGAVIESITGETDDATLE